MNGYLSRQQPKYQKAEQLVEMWETVAPAALKSQCRLAGYAAGVLTVEVATGPFLHQMQMLRHKLKNQLQQRCPRSGLREIRVVPGRAHQENNES